MKEHRWVRHAITDVEVCKEMPELKGDSVLTWHWNIIPGFFIRIPSREGDHRSVFGCDDCNQPLTPDTFDEPCLSELDEEMDAVLDRSDEEEGS